MNWSHLRQCGDANIRVVIREIQVEEKGSEHIKIS